MFNNVCGDGKDIVRQSCTLSSPVGISAFDISLFILEFISADWSLRRKASMRTDGDCTLLLSAFCDHELVGLLSAIVLASVQASPVRSQPFITVSEVVDAVVLALHRVTDCETGGSSSDCSSHSLADSRYCAFSTASYLASAMAFL